MITKQVRDGNPEKQLILFFPQVPIVTNHPVTMSVRPCRFSVPDESGPLDCTGCSTQSCRSCGASALANCVALCCCPCAMVSFFTLALVKAPYMAGRRCVKLVKKRRGLLRKKRVRSLEDHQEESCTTVRLSKEWSELGQAGFGIGLGEGRRLSSRLDSERVWMELYQVGHWGFGRVSFAGIGQQGRGNLGKDGNIVGQ